MRRPPWELLPPAWTGRYEPRGDPAAADCLVALAFGGLRRRGRLLPGPSNEDLARLAWRRWPHLPRVFQGEVADAHAALAGADGPRVIALRTHRQPGRYLDTRELLDQARLVLAAEGWARPLLLAHPHHVPRGVAACRALGIAPIVPAGLGEVRFCRGSYQGWTRDRYGWILREVPAVAHYWLKRWV